ncbi:MAG: cytochrome c family protein [Pseudomonadota bacterium]
MPTITHRSSYWTPALAISGSVVLASVMLALMMLALMMLIPATANADQAKPDYLTIEALASGDAARGRKLYRKCKICHALSEDKHRVGPSLYGIIGRKAGSANGYTKYSKAMRNADLVWTVDRIDRYIINPRAFIKGTRMVFAGMPKQKDRRDLLRYLLEAGGKQP